MMLLIFTHFHNRAPRSIDSKRPVGPVPLSHSLLPVRRRSHSDRGNAGAFAEEQNTMCHTLRQLTPSTVPHSDRQDDRKTSFLRSASNQIPFERISNKAVRLAASNSHARFFVATVSVKPALWRSLQIASRADPLSGGRSPSETTECY